MDDKNLGYSIMIITAIIMIGYFIWLFPGVFGSLFSWLVPFREWAIKLPVIAAVYLLLFIVLWIGYTMATTPPPIPLESPLDLETQFIDPEDSTEDVEEE